MPSYPPVQSVVRALSILQELNQRRATSVNQLHQSTGLPKPTIVRLLETLIAEGYVASDKRLSGYCVTSMVQKLSAGYHGAPMVVEAARPWCTDLTRRLKWPISIAMLEDAAVAVRFSTIPDSPMSPFHATLNMRLSLISRALGRAYIAFCPRDEQDILIRLLADSTHPEDQPADLNATVRDITRRVQSLGYAERDPTVEPRSSSTIAVPIFYRERVLATTGLTFFRSAVSSQDLTEILVPALTEMAHQIEKSVAVLIDASGDIAEPTGIDRNVASLTAGLRDAVDLGA